MPFIGSQPTRGAYLKCDAITTSATASYTLQVNGGSVNPASANNMIVSLNGVIQAPQDAYTVSGSTITFDSALTSSDVIDFILILGNTDPVGTPADGTITTNKLQNNAVTNAKIANSTIDLTTKTTGSLPIAQGGTVRTAELHSAWVMSPQISSPGSSTGLMQWAKDAASTTDNLIGTDVTMSSGVISFPSTGLYKLTVDLQGRQGSSSVTYVGFTWEHSSDSGNSFSTVWRRLTNSISGGYFAFMSDFYYNVTNISTQRLKALHYATALSGLVIDGGQGYTSTRLYITKVS